MQSLAQEVKGAERGRSLLSSQEERNDQDRSELVLAAW